MKNHRPIVFVAALLIVVCGILVCGSCVKKEPAAPAKAPSPTGDYIGQTPPGATPELFAPGIVSTGLYERDIAMTPDGNEIYFGVITAGDVAIAFTKRVNGVWTTPEIAPFCSDPAILNLEPHVTPDGKRFLFLSTRPKEGQEKKPGWVYQDIWAMDRAGDTWGEPYNLGSPADKDAPVNTDAPEYYPSATRNGTLYFTRDVTENGKSRSLVHRSQAIAVVHSEGWYYGTPEILPPEVNASDHQFNAFIDPDERYLVFCIANDKRNIGPCDYYVSFRSEEGVWTGPVNMGELINTPENTVGSPYVSPDGRYFFFASTRRARPVTARQTGAAGQPGAGAPVRTYETIQEMETKPQNGNSDVYWIDASFIDTLRPKPAP